jgi:OPA family glycerol-3-phosphate transporter-like MFS transporter
MKPRHRRLLAWQVLTLALLLVGYSGYYLCRSNLSVAMPMIQRELSAGGIAEADALVRLGTMASLGTLAYALGKFVGGGLADRFGGRRNFLAGMLGSVAFTALFALGGALPIFTLAWIGNRLIQSLGWVGMVKITSHWFSASTYATAMAVVSLSYLFGDAVARQFMGWLLTQGLDWRHLFYTGAAVLLCLFLVSTWLLKETPRDIGEPEPPAGPDAIVSAAQGSWHRPGVTSMALRLLRNRTFCAACVLSLGLTLVRESFNTWTPTYFNQAVGLSMDEAAKRSALFPFFGGVSVLLAGWLGDVVGRIGRAVILLAGLVLTGAALLVLGCADFGGSQDWPVFWVASIGFVMIGPYSYLAGAVALDFGGKEASATACGIIDGVGYLGGFLAGDSVARVSVAWGWSGAFTILAGVAWASCIAAVVFLTGERSAAAARLAKEASQGATS